MDEQKDTNQNNPAETEEPPAGLEPDGSEQAEESEAAEELELAEDEGGGDEVPAEEIEEKPQEPEADVLDQIVLAETTPAELASDEPASDEVAVDEESEAGGEPAADEVAAVEEPAGLEELDPFTQETLAVSMASATAPAAPAATKSGCGFWAYLFTAVLGAFLGVVLTLALLVAMNGSLRFNESAQIRLLEQQIDRSLATAEAEQADLTGEVTSLDERIKIVATLESETSATLIIIGTDVESLSGDFSALQTEAQGLDKRLVIIDERVVAMAAAAKDFDAFLEGLRTLLLEMEDEATEGTVTAEATGTVEDPGKSPTAKATTVQPTRTPRPTATPLIPAASSPTPAR
jgi:hypothetical protein